MIVTVDTNIIFSVLVNTNSTIGDLLINSDDYFKYYCCAYMRFEIEKHWAKLLKASKLSEEELRESQYRVYKKIHFLSEDIMPAEVWIYAENVVKDIDIDDIDFVAINEYLDGILWTGDKELYAGLKSKGYEKVCNTSEMIKLRNEKANPNRKD
jgi:predicted nucleic acid-binding protein